MRLRVAQVIGGLQVGGAERNLVNTFNAMAHGLPVVSTDAGAAAETVGHYRAGYPHLQPLVRRLRADNHQEVDQEEWSPWQLFGVLELRFVTLPTPMYSRTGYFAPAYGRIRKNCMGRTKVGLEFSAAHWLGQGVG